MNDERRPKAAHGTPAKKSNRSIRPASAENLLRHALANGDAGTARLVAWLLGRTA